MSKASRAALAALLPESAATRAVGSAASMLSPAEAARVSARMNAVNAIAPGGASVATSAMPELGTQTSRFAAMASDLGASPNAAASAEANLTSQTRALRGGARALGEKMDALDGEMHITPELRTALGKARPILGGKTPDMLPADELDANPLGIEKSTPVSPFTANQQTMSIQDARDALSRLRFMSRNMGKRGVDAPGVTLRDVNAARDALQQDVYAQSPDFATLDQQYAQLANEQRSVNHLLKTVQRSRSIYANRAAFGTAGASISGKVPLRATDAVLAAARGLIPSNRAAATADALNRLVMTPGATVQGLFDAAPGAPRVTPVVRAGISTSLPRALKGLLFPQDDDEQP